MIFLDTSCFIYLFENHPEFAPKLEPVFDSIATAPKPYHTSVISLAETLVKPLSLKRQDLVDKYLAIFHHTPNLTLHQVDSRTSQLAAHIRSQYNFFLLDCFQLALAQAANCQGFYTNDKQLTKFKDIKVQLISSL